MIKNIKTKKESGLLMGCTNQHQIFDGGQYIEVNNIENKT